MNTYRISYIVSTKNRLSYLKILEEHIFLKINSTEEIIVVDGESTDGSKEFLQKLFQKKIIHQYISQPDKNQAHGWNKALLMANGSIVKKIIDDDVFDLDAIRKCADWMHLHPEVDLCISDCLNSDLYQTESTTLASRLPFYLAWKNKLEKCFTFSDVYLLIRKNALSKFGLFDTQFRMIDWEYSLRCSYLQANIAYYTGCNALAVSSHSTITSTSHKQTLIFESKIGHIKYGYLGDRSKISIYSETKIFLGKHLKKLSGKQNRKSMSNRVTDINESQLFEIYREFYRRLADYNLKSDFKIIS